MTAPWKLPIVLLCWQGTGVDMWTGPPADVGRAAAAARPDVFYFQPVGNWTAAIPPYMGVGLTNGYNEGVRLSTPGIVGDEHTHNYIIPVGYSAGAICGARWWRDFIIPAGQQTRVPCGIMFGPPMRCPGKANGNAYAGWEMPPPDHGGIAGPHDLRPEQTPDTWLDFVQTGSDHGETEIYGNCRTGTYPWPPNTEVNEGFVETAVYNACTAPDIWSGIDAFFKMLETAANPGLVQAIYTGWQFFMAGLAADHYNYPTDAAVRYLVDVVAPKYT